jgi:hypothetical protein
VLRPVSQKADLATALLQEKAVVVEEAAVVAAAAVVAVADHQDQEEDNLKCPASRRVHLKSIIKIHEKTDTISGGYSSHLRNNIRPDLLA